MGRSSRNPVTPPLVLGLACLAAAAFLCFWFVHESARSGYSYINLLFAFLGFILAMVFIFVWVRTPRGWRPPPGVGPDDKEVLRRSQDEQRKRNQENRE